MISVIIPTYEMYGEGDKFLTKSLTHMARQSFEDFEVIISDHSKDDKIKNVTNQFENMLNIRYFKNQNNIGNSSSNLNNGIRMANGNIIKILFQDEYLINDGLKKINDFFLKNKSVYWLLTGCCYGSSVGDIKGRMIPSYTNKIKEGINTIGSPSVLTFKNENVEYFDENLIWLMDCEYYYRLEKKFGLPSIIEEDLVFVTQHKNQLTNKLSDDLKFNEHKYMNKLTTNG